MSAPDKGSAGDLLGFALVVCAGIAVGIYFYNYRLETQGPASDLDLDYADGVRDCDQAHRDSVCALRVAP